MNSEQLSEGGADGVADGGVDKGSEVGSLEGSDGRVESPGYTSTLLIHKVRKIQIFYTIHFKEYLFIYLKVEFWRVLSSLSVHNFKNAMFYVLLFNIMIM